MAGNAAGDGVGALAQTGLSDVMSWLLRYESGGDAGIEELEVLLAERPASVNIATLDGTTATMLAVRNWGGRWARADQERILLTLLRAGGSLYQADARGLTPLTSMAVGEHKEFIFSVINAYRTAEEARLNIQQASEVKRLDGCTACAFSKVCEHVLYFASRNDIIAWSVAQGKDYLVAHTGSGEDATSLAQLKKDLVETMDALAEAEKVEEDEYSIILSKLRRREQALLADVDAAERRNPSVQGLVVFTAPINKRAPPAPTDAREEWILTNTGYLVKVLITEEGGIVVQDDDPSTQTVPSPTGKSMTRLPSNLKRPTSRVARSQSAAVPFLQKAQSQLFPEVARYAMGEASSNVGCYVDTVFRYICTASHDEADGSLVLTAVRLPTRDKVNDDPLGVLRRPKGATGFTSAETWEYRLEDPELNIVAIGKVARMFVFFTSKYPVVFSEGVFTHCGEQSNPLGRVRTGACACPPTHLIRHQAERAVIAQGSELVEVFSVEQQLPQSTPGGGSATSATANTPPLSASAAGTTGGSSVALRLLFCFPKETAPRRPPLPFFHVSQDLLLLYQGDSVAHTLSSVQFLMGKGTVLTQMEPPLQKVVSSSAAPPAHVVKGLRAKAAQQQQLQQQRDPPPYQMHLSRSGGLLVRFDPVTQTTSVFRGYDRVPEGGPAPGYCNVAMCRRARVPGEKRDPLADGGDDDAEDIRLRKEQERLERRRLVDTFEAYVVLGVDEHAAYEASVIENAFRPVRMGVATGHAAGGNPGEPAAAARAAAGDDAASEVDSMFVVKPRTRVMEAVDMFRRHMASNYGHAPMMQEAMLTGHMAQFVKLIAKFAAPLPALRACVETLHNFEERGWGQQGELVYKMSMHFSEQKGLRYIPPHLPRALSYCEKAPLNCIVMSTCEIQALSPFLQRQQLFLSRMSIRPLGRGAADSTSSSIAGTPGPKHFRNRNKNWSFLVEQFTPKADELFVCTPELPTPEEIKAAKQYKPKQRLLWGEAGVPE